MKWNPDRGMSNKVRSMNRTNQSFARSTAAVLIVILGGLSHCARVSAAPPETKPVKNGSVTVRAFADQTAATPGGTINVAVVLEIEKEWHVYWRSQGGLTGMPTEIEWSGPEGCKFGRTLFPVPEAKFDKEIEETSFILADKPVFVTPVRLPKSIASQKEVVLRLKAKWLACQKACIPGSADLALTIPVAKSAGQANQKLFEDARAAFPISSAKAEHFKIFSRIDPAEAKPDGKFTAYFSIQIEPKHHMQSHKPLQEELIPATIFVEPTDGLEFDEVAYPVGKVRTDKVLGKLSEYEGGVDFKILVTVDKDVDKSGRWIRGVFQSQICTDAGTCYPPQFVEFAIPVRMEGGLMPSKPPDDQAAAPSRSQSTAGTSATSDVSSQNIFQRFEAYLLALGYVGALIVALIGGLMLNLMPCVLPVISLKILSFVRQAHEHRARVFWLGLTYCAGILVFFSAVALVYYSTNRRFSWGEQFQRPHVVLGLAGIVTAFSLSLFGVWAVFTPRVINKLGERAEGEGFSSAFATGLLATFLGTACTAPFLSAAIGAASKFSPGQGAMIFVAVGFGMALPFVVLAAKPEWLKFVPRPGPWMLTFEYLMGFLLLGTVIWIINPLRNQIGGEGLLLSLMFLLGVAVAAWIKGMIQFTDPWQRKLALYLFSTVVLVIGWIIPFHLISTIDELRASQIESLQLIADGQIFRRGGGGAAQGYNLDWSRGIPWQKYRRELALRDVRNGYTVFVDYTADWCVNCKTMLKTAIERPDVIKAMRELKVIPYTADYTLPVPEIKEDLQRFGRGGVPVFVVYRPNDPDHPEILPDVITSGILVEALQRAGPSKVAMATKQSQATP